MEPSRSHQMFQAALSGAKKQLHDTFLELARTEPGVFRMGLESYMQPIMTPKDRTELRQELAQLDVQELGARLREMQKTSGTQEVIELLAGGQGG